MRLLVTYLRFNTITIRGDVKKIKFQNNGLCPFWRGEGVWTKLLSIFTNLVGFGAKMEEVLEIPSNGCPF